MFFVWKRNGIFIPVIVVLAYFVGGFIGSSLAPELAMWGIALTSALITVSLFVFAFGPWGRTTVEIRFYRGRGETPIGKERHSFLLIPALGWATLSLLVTCLWSAVAYFVPQEGVGLVVRCRASDPGKAFLVAHMSGGAATRGLAQGNTEGAVMLAEDIAQRLRTLHEAAPAGFTAPLDGFTYGHFITHCEITNDKCAILINVPGLRHLDAEARDRVAHQAWQVAQQCLATFPVLPRPTRIVVGIRGIFLYDRVLTGRLHEPTPASTAWGTKAAPEAFQSYYAGSGIPRSSETYFITEADRKAVASQVRPPATSVAAAAGAAPRQVVPKPVRDWKSADGRILRGTFVSFKEGHADIALFLKEADGLQYEIPLTKFAEEHQAELQRMRTP